MFTLYNAEYLFLNGPSKRWIDLDIKGYPEQPTSSKGPYKVVE